MKRLLAFILTIVMVLGVLPVSGQTAQAAGGGEIELGKIVWSKDKTTYRFPGVKASFTGNKAQQLFCLSVSNGGSFVVADDFQFVGNNRTVKAIRKKGNDLEYITLVEHGGGTGIAGKELTSITVQGTEITNEQIQAFIRGLTFKRNGVAPEVQQEVSVLANEYELQDNEIAMTTGGKIHYYRHVKFNDEDKPVEERATWYDAYNEAKKAELNGMKGYLATITDENEELYLYGAFGGGIQAWIGGARTHTEGITFDADTMPDDVLNPGGTRMDGKDGGTVARDWYWMCGPEAGTPFYRTNSVGDASWGSGEDRPGPIEDRYHDWNVGEPNNRPNLSEPKITYQAEYALEYGYERANWNDYSPYNVTRQGYGMSGYIIEFSPYDLPNESGKNPSHVEETSPSVTGVEVVWVKDGELSMTVKDFIIKKSELDTFDESAAKEKADVTAVDEETEIPYTSDKITVDASKMNEIKTKGDGEYDLSYTYTNDAGKSVTEAAKVTVVDETKADKGSDGADVEIGANNFDITVEQANAIAKDPAGHAQLIKNLANAAATSNGEMVDPDDITVKQCEIKAQKGSYPVIFEYKGVEVTVQATVFDNGSEKVTVNIAANDFTVKQGSSAVMEDSFVEKSNATATASDGSVVKITLNPDDLTALNQAIANGPLGDYKVKVTATSVNGATAETVVTVKVVQYPYISEHDFIISVEDAKKATEDDIKTASDAKLLKTDTEKGDPVPIVVPSGDVSKLNKVTEPGKVPDITLQDTTNGDKAADRKVTATVVDETKKGWADDDSTTNAYIVIGANHFNLTVKQAQEIKKDPNGDTAQNIMKTLANAVCTNNGKDKSEWIEATENNIEPKNGIYTVTFSYWGQKVTVNATVKDEGAADNSKPAGRIPDINLTANDFSIPAKSPVLETAPEDTFKKMADVVAKDNDGSSITDVTPDGEQLEKLALAVKEGKKGEYPVKVTAKDENGTTVTTTVTVTVTDEGGDSAGADTTDPKPGDEHIGANNFVIGTDDFPLLTPENVLKLSNAEAYEIDTKKDVPITKVDTSKVENKPGQYPITLSTDKGTSTTVYVTIDENWKTIGDVDKASDANKKNTSVDQDKAVPAKTPDQPGNGPADTKGDDKIFELSNPKDVTQDLDPGREPDNISLGGTTLPAGDYTVSGTTLTIKSSALTGKPEGTYPVVVYYKDGSKKTFNVVVVDKDVQDESHMSGDELNKRDDLPLLLAKGIGGDKKISLSWLKYKGAAGYEIYWSYCNGKKVYKKVTSTKKLKATHKKLSYKKSYKYFVIAYKMVGDKKVYIAKSPQIHVAMKKDKRTNAKKVIVKKGKVTLKPGKTSKIKASMTREDKKKKLLQHAKKFRYYTDDYRVAKVDQKGKIKAVAPGKCNIYVIANNGVYKKVKVTVKK